MTIKCDRCQADSKFHGLGHNFCWGCYSTWILSGQFYRGLAAPAAVNCLPQLSGLDKSLMLPLTFGPEPDTNDRG